MVASFLDKYYPSGTILKLTSVIFQFIQRPDEPLFEAVARFKGLLRKCPNHGFTVDHQVGILYNGFNEQICAMLDSGANGGSLRKSGVDARGICHQQPWVIEGEASIETDEENSLAKEVAKLRVRVNQMDTSRSEDQVPPTSIIAITKPDAEAAPIEDFNYMQQGGGRNHSFNNNNYRPNQGGGNYNNYNGNRPRPNISYSNNNFLQPPAGFNVGKGGVVEPAKKQEKYEAGIMKILEVLVQDRKTNDTKIRVMEARLNNLKAGITTLTTVVTSFKTQMDQVQQKIEEVKKSAARVADINKKWVAKQKAAMRHKPEFARHPADRSKFRSRPLRSRQRHLRPRILSCVIMGLCFRFSQRGSLSLRSNLSTS